MTTEELKHSHALLERDLLKCRLRIYELEKENAELHESIVDVDYDYKRLARTLHVFRAQIKTVLGDERQ